MPEKVPLLILGTGAMACLFGARLSSVAEVTLLGTWAAGLAALERDGIELQEADGSTAHYPVQVARTPQACHEVKMALVLVKSWQTERAARQLRECLDPQGVALTLQNGLGNLEVLQDGLGVERAALGVTTMGATLLGPGRVRVGGAGPTYMAAHPRLDRLTEMLLAAGFAVEIVGDLDRLLWRKLAVNAGINPLTAILDVPNGVLLENEPARALMQAAAREAALVAGASGVDLSEVEAGELVEQVARRTALNLSSMLQDMRRGAPTEIDAISGAIVNKGARVDLPTPVNWVLWKLVQASLETAREGDRL